VFCNSVNGKSQFIPVPSESDTAIPLSLFDRQLPTYLRLPEPAAGVGQVVITSGDVMLRFEPAEVKFAAEGVTGLSCYALPKQASRHSVFCRGQEDKVKLYLQQVVGGYLNRQRATMATLKQIHTIAEEVTDALICKDIATFGHLVDVAWQLNKQLDPNSSNDEIELLFERVHPFIYGAKLLGAGGGGFMLMICKSAQDALSVREMLETEPPNERARFFDFDISNEGLTVTVS